MFNGFKKITMLLLPICVLCAAFSVSAYTGGDGNYDDKAKFLNLLGVIEYNESASGTEGNVSRGDFALYAAALLKADNGRQSDKRYFADVPADHWAGSAINYLAECGYVSVGDDKMFRPSEAITVAESLKILSEALGYGAYAQSRGGFPDGYYSIANEFDINIGGLYDKLTVAGAVNMIYDFLDVPFYGVNGKKAGEFVYGETDTTILSSYYNIYKKSGTVTATDMYSVSGRRLKADNTVMIDGVIYNSETDFNNELGRYATFFYRQGFNDAEGEIVFLSSLHKKDTVLELDTESFIEYSSRKNEVSYYNETEKKESVTLSSNAVIIKNGEVIGKNTALAFTLSKGKIKLIDTGNDGNYDYAFIYEYENYAADYVSQTDGTVYDKVSSGKSVLLDESFSDKKIVIYNSNNKEIGFGEIPQDAVISVYASADITVAYVCTDVITGTVFESSAADNTIELLIGKNIADTMRYKLDKDYYRQCFSGSGIPVGGYGDFYLDASGKIAYINNKSEEQWLFAYLVANTVEPSVDGSVMLKLYTQKGELNTYKASKRIRIDGLTFKAPAEILNALDKTAYKSTLAADEDKINGQLVRIKAADGIITDLDTERRVTGHEDTYSINRATELSQKRYVYATNTYGDKIIMNSKTVVFGVPSFSELGGADEDDFCIPKPMDFCNGTSPVESFKLNLESGYDDAVVIHNPRSCLFFEYDFYLVEDIVNSVSADNEEIKKVIAWFSGIKYELYGAPGHDFSGAGVGDIIMISYDLQGKVYDTKILYDYSRRDDPNYTINWTFYLSSSHNDYGEISHAYLTGISDGVIGLSFTKPDYASGIYNTDYVAPMNGTVVTVFDGSFKSSRIYNASVSELVPAKNLGAEAKPYFFCLVKGVIKSVFIYK